MEAGGGVALTSVIFWQRPSNPNNGDELVREVKESGNMVAKQRKEVWKAGDNKGD